MAKVVEILAESLEEAGVRYVFGIPGGPWIPYLDALKRTGIEFVLVANEASAGFMADVCARITGRPAACHGTFGPGATNLTTGVGCALLDRSPLIAFTSEQSDGMLRRTTQMNIDHQALFSPLTKWTTRLSRNDLRRTLRKALEVATAEPPGPVHLGLPSDLAEMEGGEETPEAFQAISAPAPSPDPEALSRAAEHLREAKRPLAALGLTAARLGLRKPILDFLERHPMPVVLTPMAKGLVPETHPAYAGVLFHALSDRLDPIIRTADLVIGIGYDPVEYNYEEWLPRAPLVHLDTRPADVASWVDLAADVTGDPAPAVETLAASASSPFTWDPADLARCRRSLAEAFTPGKGTFGPRAALHILRNVLPLDGIMTCDVGAHTHLIGQLWPTPAPGLQIMTNGWSSMGFGVPAAMAAKLCRKERAVVCVTGDGGFLMMAGEMVTARRLGLPVVFLVLADRELALIRVKEERKGLPPVGVDLYRGDLFDADRFFGVPVLTARDGDSLRRRLEEALSLPGPAIVQAVVDGSEYSHLIAAPSFRTAFSVRRSLRATYP